MELEGTPIDVETNAYTVIMNEEDARELGVYTLDRINLHYDGGKQVAVVETTEELVPQGKIGLTRKLHTINGKNCFKDDQCNLRVTIASPPGSIDHIKAKMDGQELDKEQLKEIIDDINRDALSDIELGAYVSSIYTEELSLQEAADLTNAMVEAGERISWDAEILADKHSIGGVPGNRVTPIIIPIIAAAGIKIPKTSSRAITSPAGTADTVEVLCDVEFGLDEIRDIVNRTNGCLVWGGGVNLSPVDDKIIRAEHPLSLDPEGQVIASVLSKKKSAGSTHVIIDIPYGEGSKVGDFKTAKKLAEKFQKIGRSIDMNVQCAITLGDQPIGNGIGPALEARDCLKVLQGDGPVDLKIKSIRLSNILLEMCGHEPNAEEILENGEALTKFREIIGAQNGNPDVTPEDVGIGKYKKTITSEREGVVNHLNNKKIANIAFRAGAPKDNGAGVYLHKKENDHVEKGDILLTIYADNRSKLEEAEQLWEEEKGYRIQDRNEMLVEEM